MSHPHITPEQLQKGLQFQREMMERGFNKIHAIRSHSAGIDIDISDAREHFQHVHALIANTATQRIVRDFVEVLKEIKNANYEDINTSQNVLEVVAEKSEWCNHCLSELEAQFNDLAEKIFPNDKPTDNETTAQAEKV